MNGYHGREEHHSGCGCGGHHRYATMTLEEEVQYLEEVKARLEEKLTAVNTKLGKLKA
jgi:hypothetical protein